MEEMKSDAVSSTKAVLLGALASGVNGPTWSATKMSFTMLGICLTAMLALAFSSQDLVIASHVVLLVAISGTLFVLLNRFLAETGFVSIEQQMKEMGLSGGQHIQEENKRK